MTDERQYQGISPEELQQELGQLWQELQRDDSAISEEARDAGIDLSEVRRFERPEDALEVKPGGAHLDPLLGAVIVAVAPTVAKTASHIIISLWDKVLLPWIQHRRGAGTLTEASGNK